MVRKKKKTKFPDRKISETFLEYSDDLRMIGEYKVTQKRGQWRLWAEARDSSTID
jgi:hypothetical protein